MPTLVRRCYHWYSWRFTGCCQAGLGRLDLQDELAEESPVAGHETNWDNAIARRRGRLIELLRKAAEPNEVLAEAMAAIEELEQLHRADTPVRQGRIEPASRAGGVPRRGRSPEPAARFVVERTRRGAYLTEHFSSARLPFRCPESVYEAAVQVMDEIRKPTPFEEILFAVRKSSGQSLPDYLLRVCIRFWLSAEPPLIEKVHARYRPTRPAQFGREARRAWKQLAEQAE